MAQSENCGKRLQTWLRLLFSPQFATQHWRARSEALARQPRVCVWNIQFQLTNANNVAAYRSRLLCSHRAREIGKYLIKSMFMQHEFQLIIIIFIQLNRKYRHNYRETWIDWENATLCVRACAIPIAEIMNIQFRSLSRVLCRPEWTTRSSSRSRCEKVSLISNMKLLGKHE